MWFFRIVHQVHLPPPCLTFSPNVLCFPPDLLPEVSPFPFRKKGWSLKIVKLNLYCQFWTLAHAFSCVDFGGKMLARSLKNIWTDEKLVYLCSAKDKMVSNLTTVLPMLLIKCPMTILWSQTANSTVPAGVRLVHLHVSWSDLCVYIRRGSLGWVKSGDAELSYRLQAILSRAWGG